MRGVDLGPQWAELGRESKCTPPRREIGQRKVRGEKNIGEMQGLAIALLGSKSQDDDRGNVLGAGVVPGNLSQQAMTMELDSSDILSSSRLP